MLIPGCGLGRLAWDVAKAGHIAEGNEFSYFMLLTSNFVFNQSVSIQILFHSFGWTDNVQDREEESIRNLSIRSLFLKHALPR